MFSTKKPQECAGTFSHVVNFCVVRILMAIIRRQDRHSLCRFSLEPVTKKLQKEGYAVVFFGVDERVYIFFDARQKRTIWFSQNFY